MYKRTLCTLWSTGLRRWETKGHHTVKKKEPRIDPWVTSEERAVDEDDIFLHTIEWGENDTSYSFRMFQTVIQTPRFTLSKAGERSRRIKIQQASLQKKEQWQASGQRPLNNGATLQEEEFQWVNAERAQVNINH